MEAIAVEMLREVGPSTREDMGFGGLEISSARREADGRVYFYDADGFVGSTGRGWVYSPGTEPTAGSARRFEKLSGDWYSFVFAID
ncbi:hypothetical protein [Nocardia asiatica]|uniref:hypothetical protein n=1 Tax=Nocardia asiatica TaxID=209252 RepID=UPI002457F8D5|nr:hypothetical protein [Nocardia asiatica]